MSFDLKNLTSTGDMKPPRLLIYGPPGKGKTSLAASFPNPIIIDIEDGTPAGVEIQSMGEIEKWEDVIDRLAALVKQKHNFETLIIDSLDRLEPLIWEAYCEDNEYHSIEEPGFGKGYIEVLDYWNRLVNACNMLRNKKNMTIIFIAHSTVTKFDDPKAGSYSQYNSRLHKKANDLIQDDVDAILFVNQDVSILTEDEGFNKKSKRAAGGHHTFIYCTGKPGHIAKNRFDMPDEILYEKDEGFEALEPYLPIGEDAEPEKEEA